MYKYFVTYSYKTTDGDGFGNKQITTDEKITDLKDIRDWERMIEEEYPTSLYVQIVILFIYLLGEDKP